MAYPVGSRRARADGRQSRGRARDGAALATMRCRWSWSRRSMDMRAARAVPMRLTPAAGARLTAAGSGPVPLVLPMLAGQQATITQHALGQLGRRRHVVAHAGLCRQEQKPDRVIERGGSCVHGHVFRPPWSRLPALNLRTSALDHVVFDAHSCAVRKVLRDAEASTTSASPVRTGWTAS